MSRHNEQEPEFTLTSADADAVDALMMMQAAEDVAMTSSDVPPPFAAPSTDDARIKLAASVFRMLDVYEPQSSLPPSTDDLVARTLMRVRESGKSYESQTALKFRPAPVGFTRVDPEEAMTSIQWRAGWREVLSVAAVILILLGVTVPVMSNARDHAIRLACRSNMMSTSLAFTNYAADFQGALPVANTQPPAGNWMDNWANSGNLFVLARTDYAPLETITCPGNPFAQLDPEVLKNENWTSRDACSYSYQNQFGGHPSKWDSPKPIAVLSDRNPLVSASCDMRPPPPAVTGTDRSRCHGGLMQTVLVNDGGIRQLDSPVFHGDNIWLPRNASDHASEVTRLDGTECPDDEFDSMLIQ